MTLTIRSASTAPDSPDAAACAAIYAPYVTDTWISFELEPPTATAMAQRIASAHAWLVAVDSPDAGAPDVDGTHSPVLGYAYATRHRERAAYQWACDVSVYVAEQAQRRGVGRALYERLLAQLATQGLRMACAGIALPNDASIALHTSLGFEPIGTYRDIGWKHGGWRDVHWMQLPLGEPGAPPAALTNGAESDRA